MILLAISLLGAAPAAQVPKDSQATVDRAMQSLDRVQQQAEDVIAVAAAVDRMFAGLAARDGKAILAVVRPEGGATVAVERPDGTRAVRHLSWSEFAAGLTSGPEKYREKLTDPVVRIEGDIAMVWGRYTFFLDGKPQHCGVDHFDLVREGGAWKVLNVTWSQRTTGCS